MKKTSFKMNVFNDEYFMKRALDEAYAAYEKDEVPVGAVIVHKDKIIVCRNYD